MRLADANELDGTTLSAWAGARADDDGVRGRFLTDTTFGMGSTGGDVSLLAALHYANSAGSPDLGHDRFIREGFSSLVDHLRSQISGATILLDAPVESVARVGELLSVRAGRRHVTAPAVVLAMSPTLLRRIRLDEVDGGIDWPPARYWRQEPSVKAALDYDRPFWSEAGLSGNIAGAGEIAYVINTSTPDRPQLTVLWNLGAHGRGREEIRRTILDHVSEHLGPAAAEPSGIAITDWSLDPYAGGCGSPLPPGVLTSGDPFAATLAPGLLRAGTESSPMGWGSVEGAIRSGIRAAEELAR
ncbi:Putative flavin-containing monoamine oxidase AofH [Leucobacter soli]|uniref:Flavin-containing monoamine oxidase AofH n=1 Tax=Leucobacter soli TaxID=2812850 RepID=A0A916JRJ2_9MICO|nr:Putative flavin-containing monoamine oxidase AofH [Leucobacter soli]